MSLEANEIDMLFEKLNTSLVYEFPALGEKLMAPEDRGVYIVLSECGDVLHVGNTPRAKNGINQRLKGHLSGSSSFVNSYFQGQGSLLRNGCGYKYLIVESARQRALLEAYAIGTLCPKHLGHG